MSTDAANNPVDLVRNHIRSILGILEKDTSQSHSTIRHQIELIAEPLFDFQRLTSLAVGPDWHKASSIQKDQLTAAFQQLFVRVYSQTMKQFKAIDLAVNEKAIMQDSNRRATVKSIFTFQTEPKIVKIDYVLFKLEDTWRAIDVHVDGGSLVSTYRAGFTQKIQMAGIDGLIEYLESK